MADIETLRLEREEKRRLRRERIRRILEDDDTPTRRTREERVTESSRSSATTRRPRDQGVTPSSERTRARQEVEKATETSSTRTTRNTRETKTSTDTSEDTSSKMKARRDARRKRNQEHDLKQNKLTLENGEAHNLEKSSARDQSAIGGGSSEVKERVAARRRNRGEDSSRADSKLSATDRLGDDTPQKTLFGHEAEEESKDNGTSDPKIKNTSLKKVNVLHVDDFLEKGDENKTENTEVNDTEKAQDENKPRVIETEISAKIENISESVIETKDEEQVGKLDAKKEDEEVKEVNGTKVVDKDGEQVEKLDAKKEDEEAKEVDGTKEVEDGIGKDIEKKDEQVEKGDVEKSEKGNKVDTSGKCEKVVEPDGHREEKISSSDGWKERRRKEKQTEVETIDISKVDGKKKEEVEEETKDQPELETSKPGQPVASGILGTVKVEIDLGNDGSSKDNEDFGDTEIDGEARGDSISKGVSPRVDDVSDVSNSRLLGDDKQGSIKEDEMTVNTSTDVADHSILENEISESKVDGSSIGGIRKEESSETKESSTQDDKEISTHENKESSTQEHEETSTQEPEESNTQENKESSTQGNKEIITQEPKDSTQENKESSTQENKESSTQEDKESNTQENKETSTKETKESSTQESKETSTQENKESSTREPKESSTQENKKSGTQEPKKPITKSDNSSRVSKMKVGDDSWKKNVRKKRGVTDVDRSVELTVLGRTGKIKNKMKSCETRDTENVAPWKKQVKKGIRKHKSMDEEAEKELNELSRKRELKSRVEECEEKDKESADAWKREVKKTVRKHKSLDEDTGNELKELSKARLMKSRVEECNEKDKEAKLGTPVMISDEAEVGEDLKEFSGSGKLKNLIASCAERDDKRDEAWKSAKEKKKLKSADEEEELKELSNLSELKTKIIKTYEERDKESAEDSKKQIKTGEGAKSFDETTDEELKELSETVSVKTRIQSTIEQQEKPKETPKRADPTEDEELKEINLKGRLEAYKKESERLRVEVKKRDTAEASESHEDARGSKGTAEDDELLVDEERAVTSLTNEAKTGKGVNKTSGTKKDTKGGGRMSPTRRDTSGRVSPTKDKAHHGRTSPTKGDARGRVSPAKDSEVLGRTSPTKRDTSGRGSPAKDSEVHGRTSPTKRDPGGRRSPAKDDRGGTPATKRETKGKFTPIKDDSQPKSKLASIRSNLYEAPKNKTKGKRESLDRVTKTIGIKDRIAACKERDKAMPRREAVEKTLSKAKPAEAVPDSNTLTAGAAEEGGQSEVGDRVPVNHMGDQFMTIEEETKDASIKDALLFWKNPGDDKKASGEPEAQVDQDEEVVDVDIKGKMSYWESPKRADDEALNDEGAAKESERPPTVVLGNVKQDWQKKKRNLNAAQFIKELLSAKCKRRDLKDIQDVKSGTKKYLVAKKGEEKVRGSSVTDEDIEEPKPAKKNVEEENKKNSEEAPVETRRKKIYEDFSFDDVVNPNEVKQLKDFSDFRRQVRPANRRAAKSNPVRKLQQREDLKTEADFFDDIEDEEDSPPKPNAIGRLGRPIQPGDRKSKDINTFALDALAGLSAKEDVSKITLKKTAKSRAGVSQEKAAHDGTTPLMLLQIKGHRHMQTRLVEPSVESLNSGDAFLLVTDKYLHVWLGKEANVMKKSKASELSNKILQYKLLNCKAPTVTIIKDGDVNIETGLTRTFWKLLGGKKPVKSGKNVPKDGDYEKAVVSTNAIFAVDTSSEPAKLQQLPEWAGKIPSIKMLDSDKAYVFDFGTEVYAWLGRTCDKSTRGKAVELAQEVFKDTFKVKTPLNPIHPNTLSEEEEKPRELKRPSWAVFGRMTERAETIVFEQKFLDWPDAAMKEKLDKQKDLLNKNLSSGYAKRKAKMGPVEVQLIELVSYDGAKMAEELPPVQMILEGVNVGRGRGSYDEIERRSLELTTNSVTVYHSSDKEYRQLEEKEWGHFYSAESYVIRWSYSVKTSGIRSLKGGESKREATGRDQIAYFFWHGRDCSASGKGTSALATIELDSDKSPQIMVDEGNESACFLSMFDGQMIVHHGKPDEAKSIEDDNVFMYCVHHEEEKEVSLTQIEARSSNLRSRSSFIIVVIGKSIGICVWHGLKSTKEKKEGSLRGAKRLAVWFIDMFEVKELDIVELEEGNEGSLFWEALDGKNDYGSLIQSGRKCDNRVKLFNFTSTEGPFIAKEIPNPTRGELVSPHPFRQSELYDASQPALFLVDTVYEMYLWQGWWPVNPEESDSATTTGSAEFRWHRDRRLAMQTIQSYADVVGRQMSKSYVVNAGLEPIEFRAFFPFWEDHPDVTQLNLESTKVDGQKASLPDLLAKLSRDRYTLAELRVRPLPEGVDPSKMEMYLSDEEFKDVFNISKDEFTKLPKWKKLEQRKQAGLF